MTVWPNANDGRTPVNLGTAFGAYWSYDQPLMDFGKLSASQIWGNAGTSDETHLEDLISNGHITGSAPQQIVSIPAQPIDAGTPFIMLGFATWLQDEMTAYTDDWVLTWDGDTSTGDVYLSGETPTATSAGRKEYTITSGSGTSQIITEAVGTGISNVRFFRASDEVALDAGGYVRPEAAAWYSKFKVWRPMTFQATNGSYATKWSHHSLIGDLGWSLQSSADYHPYHANMRTGMPPEVALRTALDQDMACWFCVPAMIGSTGTATGFAAVKADATTNYQTYIDSAEWGTYCDALVAMLATVSYPLDRKFILEYSNENWNNAFLSSAYVNGIWAGVDGGNDNDAGNGYMSHHLAVKFNQALIDAGRTAQEWEFVLNLQSAASFKSGWDRYTTDESPSPDVDGGVLAFSPTTYFSGGFLYSGSNTLLGSTYGTEAAWSAEWLTQYAAATNDEEWAQVIEDYLKDTVIDAAVTTLVGRFNIMQGMGVNKVRVYEGGSHDSPSAAGLIADTPAMTFRASWLNGALQADNKNVHKYFWDEMVLAFDDVWLCQFNWCGLKIETDAEYSPWQWMESHDDTTNAITTWYTNEYASLSNGTGETAAENPTSVLLSATGDTTANATWDADAGTDTWDIEHSTDYGAWIPFATGLVTNSDAITGLTAGTVARVRVKATNADGDSAWVISNNAAMPGGGGAMGYDQVDVTAPATDKTGWSHLINLDSRSTEWKAAVRADGGDIRAYDQAENQLPMHLTDGSSGWCIVKLNTLSAGGQSIRLRITEEVAQPAAGSTYGSDNAFDAGWEGMYLEGCCTDFTSHARTLLNQRTAVTEGGISGPFDGTKATTWVGTGLYQLGSLTVGASVSMFAVVDPGTAGAEGICALSLAAGPTGDVVSLDNTWGSPQVISNDGTSSAASYSGAFTDDTWAVVSGQHETALRKVFEGGTEGETSPTVSIAPSFDEFGIGARGAAFTANWAGKIAIVGWRDEAVTDDYHEYWADMLDPTDSDQSLFYTNAAWVAEGGGGALAAADARLAIGLVWE